MTKFDIQPMTKYDTIKKLITLVVNKLSFAKFSDFAFTDISLFPINFLLSSELAAMLLTVHHCMTYRQFFYQKQRNDYAL